MRQRTEQFARRRRGRRRQRQKAIPVLVVVRRPDRPDAQFLGLDGEFGKLRRCHVLGQDDAVRAVCAAVGSLLACTTIQTIPVQKDSS